MDPLLNLKRHGQHDIKMIQVYVDADVTDANNKVLELSGKKPIMQATPDLTKTCPACHMGNSPSNQNCANSGAPMNGIPVPAPDGQADPKLVEEITRQVAITLFHKMAVRIAVTGDEGYVPRDLPSPYESVKRQVQGYSHAVKDVLCALDPRPIFAALRRTGTSILSWKEEFGELAESKVNSTIQRVHSLIRGETQFKPARNPAKCAKCRCNEVCPKAVLQKNR